MEDGKCRARIFYQTIEGDDDNLGKAQRLVGRQAAIKQAAIKTGTSRNPVWLAGAYCDVIAAFTSS